MPKIYLDVLFIVNFVICFVSIDIACHILKLKASLKRQLFGALVGAASSVSVVVTGAVLVICIKLVFLILSALVAFGCRTIKRLFKYSTVLLYINAVILAFVYLLWYLSRTKRIFIINYTIYFDVSLLSLCFSVILAYTLISLADSILSYRKVKNEIYSLSVKIKDKSFKLRCLVDTGNLLCDINNGKPVVVCKSNSMTKAFLESNDIPVGFRLIPYKSAGDMSLINVITPQKALLINNLGETKELDVSIGVADEDEQEIAIINPRLIV